MKSAFLMALLAACHVEPRDLPEAEIALGWRLAPGMELRYRLETRHSIALESSVRDETWHFLVRDVDDQGVFTLEGRLEALEVAFQHGDQALGDELLQEALQSERERLRCKGASFTLSMDGRMDRLDAGSWADALPHRLLALKLPEQPLTLGESWTDAETARPYATLLPSDIAVRVTGTHRLEELTWRRHLWRRGSLFSAPSHLDAILRTEAMVLPEDARYPALDIRGDTSWNLDLGQMESRSVVVTERSGEGAGQTGTLALDLEWRPVPNPGRWNDPN